MDGGGGGGGAGIVTEISFLEKHKNQLQNRNTVRAQGNYSLLPPRYRP